MWRCACRCGNTVLVRANSISSGNTISCGCQRGKKTKHGGKGTPEYEAYHAAKRRCHRPTLEQYRNYGGRGIEFRFTCFEHFLSCVGQRPSPDYSLDRIDNDGHYEPGNVRWATVVAQANNRRTNVVLTYKGETRTLAQWADHLGVPRATIKARYSKGYSIAEILSVAQSGAQTIIKKAANE